MQKILIGGRMTFVKKRAACFRQFIVSMTWISLIVGNIVLIGFIVYGSKETNLFRERRAATDSRDPSYGPVYTRWGRTVCPDDSELVYKGVAGGSHYTHGGSGSNYLCLPLDPIFGDIKPGVQNPSIVYGAEYQADDLLSKKNAEKLLHHNVLCAVCRSRGTSIFMLPARNECYEGWKKEYEGYLMAEHYTHSGRTQFVCMDHDPEADKSGYRDENGALFYLTEGACGSLPCPPYDNGKELTCVVCSK